MTKIGDVSIDRDSVKIMGVINVSPESVYKHAIKTNLKSISTDLKKLENDGADIIDIGAMSTAPYLDTVITPKIEISRLKKAMSLSLTDSYY